MPKVRYAPILLAPPQISYLTKVLRLKAGATVYAFDGAGSEYETKLVQTGRRKPALEIVGPSPYRGADPKRAVHIGQGLTERRRLDWAVEKMTEAGASFITPLVQFGVGRAERGTDLAPRWRRIAAAASAQCGRTRIPAISPGQKLRDWAQTLPAGCVKCLLSLNCDESLAAHLQRKDPVQPVAVLIGRAAGLSSAEEQAACELGFAPVALGERVLRAETAGVVAVALILAQGGEL